jgi:peptide/nickel transport system permease protein
VGQLSIGKYILKRFLLLVFLLAAVATAVFFLLHLAPGGPEVMLLGESASQEDIDRVRESLNLDKPLPAQYLEFLGGLADFTLGTSLFNGKPVINSIGLHLSNTLYLALAAMLLTLVFSFPPAVLAAFKENTLTDASVTLASAVGFAIPNFLLGPLLILLFSVKLDWLPVSGDEGFAYIILPALTLSLSMSAPLTRIIKTAVAAELKKPYVLLAKAKGLSPFQVFRRHVLRNAMIPIVTTIGTQIGALLTGTVITETIFSWQGIGYLLVRSIHRRDYPVIQGIILTITFIYLVVHLLVDISYFLIDPRIRHELKRR